MDEATQIVVVGGHELAREGMRRILTDQGFCVVTATADDFDPANVKYGSPDLIIVSANTIDEGVDLCTLLHAAVPAARLVMLTAECDFVSISRAFAAGVDGYLTDTIACEPLVGALKLVLMGEKIVPTQIVDALIGAPFQARPAMLNTDSLDVKLSEREADILQLLVHGEPNKVISRHLSISEATVKVHVKAILRKLHVLNRTQAAIWAVHRGIDNYEMRDPGSRRSHLAAPGLAPMAGRPDLATL